MIELVVNLFRACGKPPVENGVFSHDRHCPEALKKAIEECRNIPTHIGQFDAPPSFDTVAGTASFSWELGSNEAARFYKNATDFVVGSTSLSRGIKPENYYVVSEDYLWTDTPKSFELQQAFQLCKLIRLLRQLSPGDLASSNNSDPAKLIFVLQARESQPLRSVALVTRISPELLTQQFPVLDILESLLAETSNQTIHIHEHRSIFRLAISDCLAKEATPEKSFLHLVSNWHTVVSDYNFHADCYVNKFSFEKIREDVAKASIEFASKLTNIASESASKLLGLPLSFAASLVIFKSDGIEIFAIAISCLLASILLAAVVRNQAFQVKQIKTNFDLVFGQFQDKRNGSSSDILQSIETAKTDFEAQRLFVVRVVNYSRLLVWLPSVVSCFLTWMKFETISWPVAFAIFAVYLTGLLTWWLFAKRKQSQNSRDTA